MTFSFKPLKLAFRGSMRAVILGSLLLTSALFIMVPDQALANLLITPTRVEFDNRDRGGRISIVNVSDKQKTYRMFWREQVQTAAGQYINLKKNQRVRGLNKLSSFVRFSPGTVTLEPGERQHIRLAIRRPANMKDGEYRSHLVFEAIPDQKNPLKSEKRGAEMKLYLSLSFSIPIVLRQGDISFDAKVMKADPVIKMVKDSEKMGFMVNIKRMTDYSSVGNIKLFWKPEGKTSEKQVGVLNNVAIYTENPELKVTIGAPDIEKPENGQLRVKFEGVGVNEGMLYDDYIQQIKASDFVRRE